jgi:hypothetical protein
MAMQSGLLKALLAHIFCLGLESQQAEIMFGQVLFVSAVNKKPAMRSISAGANGNPFVLILND